MRAPYKRRWRYWLANILCSSGGHAPEWTGSHYWCTRCGYAGRELNP